MANNYETIREHLSGESYKKIASFYRNVKRVGKIQNLSWFLDRELLWWQTSESELVDFVIREILLNFSYYREKPLYEALKTFRGKRK